MTGILCTIYIIVSLRVPAARSRALSGQLAGHSRCSHWLSLLGELAPNGTIGVQEGKISSLYSFINRN